MEDDDVEKTAAAQMSDLFYQWGDVEHDSDLAIRAGHLELVSLIAGSLGIDQCIEIVEYDLSLVKEVYKRAKEIKDGMVNTKPDFKLMSYDNGIFINTTLPYPEGLNDLSGYEEVLSKLGYKNFFESGHSDGPVYITIEHSESNTLWPFITTVEINNAVKAALCKTYRECLEYINLFGTLCQAASSHEVNDLLNRINDHMKYRGET